MAYIVFKQVDDMLYTLRQCREAHSQEWRGLLKNPRQAWEKRNGERCEFALALAQGQSAKGVPFAGFQEVESLDDGFAAKPVRRILEGLPLLPRKVPADTAHALAFGFRLPAGADLNGPREKLHKAWESVPRTPDGMTSYYLAKNDAEVWLLAHVTGVAPRFVVGDWVKEHEADGLEVFLPSLPEGNPLLYVDYRYEYPRARTFYDLEDFFHDEGGAEELHLILCTPEGPPRTAGSAVWHKPAWRMVTGQAMYRGEDLLALTTVDNPAASTLVAMEPETADALRLRIPVKVRSRAAVNDAMSGLRLQAQHLEAQLANVRGRLLRLDKASRHRYRVVLVFHKKAGDPAGQLPPPLADFLQRPMGELRTYSVCVGPGDEPGDTAYYLASDNPMAYHVATAIPCSRLYLQDERFDLWGLPLYLRSDAELAPEIMEEEEAELLRRCLLREEEEGGGVLYLFDPPPADSPEAAPRYTPIQPAARASDALRFFNQGRGSDKAVQAALLLEQSAAPGRQDAAADPDAKELSDQLRRTCDGWLDAVAQEFGEALSACQRNRIKVLLARLCVMVTMDSINSLGETWREFVANVCQVDEDLARLKVAALAEWHRDAATRENDANARKARLAAVKPQVDAAKADLDAAMNQIQSKRADVEAKTDQIEQRHKDAEAERDKLGGAIRTLQANNASLDEQLKELNDQLNEAKRLKSEAERKAGDIAAKKGQLATARQELDAAEKLLAEQRKELEAQEREYAECGGRFEREKSALAEYRARLDAQYSALKRLRNQLETMRAEDGDRIAEAEAAIVDIRRLAEERKPVSAMPQPPPGYSEREIEQETELAGEWQNDRDIEQERTRKRRNSFVRLIRFFFRSEQDSQQ